METAKSAEVVVVVGIPFLSFADNRRRCYLPVPSTAHQPPSRLAPAHSKSNIMLHKNHRNRTHRLKNDVECDLVLS